MRLKRPIVRGMRGGAKKKAGGAVRRDEGEGEKEEEDREGCDSRGREGRRRG